MRLDRKKMLIIGLGFFSISLTWAIYNAFVPIFLDRMIASSMVVGFVMTIDNIFGLIFQPFFGDLSDRTANGLGRRMPYLIIGVPLAALMFLLIPLHKGLITLMITVIGMNFAMSIYRAPTVALMPDSTPPQLRSKANGIINFMGGFGSVLAFLIGGYLFNRNELLPFIFGAFLMVFSLILLVILFKEPKEPYAGEDDVVEDVETEKARLFFRNGPIQPLYKKNPSLIFLLLGIFFWFTGFNGVETFFTLYAVNALGIKAGSAAILLSIFSFSFLLFAIPAGYIGTKFGRKKTILTGILVLVVSFLIMLLFPTLSTMRILLATGGIGWALININSYPTVVEMAPKGTTGRYTGYYYAFSFSASIVSPILFGFISDLMDSYDALFIYAITAFLLALLCMTMVKHGEAADV